MSFTWDITPDAALTSLTVAYVEQINREIVALANRYEGEITNWMQANAPWQDDTGEARRQLGAEVIELVDAAVLAFGHGVDYGIFLEEANQGRFQIIGPALDYFAPKIWADVQGLFR